MLKNLNQRRKQMEIKYFRKFEKGNMKGFFDLVLDTGMVITGMKLLTTKDGDTFVGFKSESYEDKNGETKWKNLCYFPDRKDGDQFQEAVVGLATEAYDNA